MIRLSTHMLEIYDKEVGLNADDKVCDKIKKELVVEDIGLGRLDEGAIPSNSTNHIKHGQRVFYGVDVGSTDVEKYIGD